jgi:hypothetical protein
MNCIFCHNIINDIPNLYPLFYCYNCADKHDVDAVFSYSCYKECYTSIHMGFTKKDLLYKLTISPLLNAMNLNSVNINNTYRNYILTLPNL